MDSAISGTLRRGMKVSPYQPLEPGHIRVLRLFPGYLDDPLRGRLQTLDLGSASTAEPYNAISYAWKSTELPNLVELPSEDFDIAITSTLHGALQRFRSPVKEVRFWADAICINQTDPAEKAAQIMRMWDVFAQARKVLVWLGDSTPLDTFAFMQIWRLGAILGIIIHDDGHDPAPAISEDTEKCFCCSMSVPADTPRWPAYALSGYWVEGGAFTLHTQTALDQLLRRDWFTMLWVVQEIAAARNARRVVYCGSHSVPWEAFEMAALRYLAMRDPDLPKIPGVRELAGLTYG